MLGDGQSSIQSLYSFLTEKLTRQFALAAFIACVALPSFAAERWEALSPTPAPIATDRGGEVEANGIKIHYAIYGQGSPVIFLHGGLANTDYWGNQVPAVRRITR